MPTTQELSTLPETRERFYHAVESIRSLPIFCGDERLPLVDYPYLHVFGGVANPAYNSRVLEVANGQATANATFKEDVSSAAMILRANDIQAGVHSDTHSEKTDQMSTEGDDPIGCGYIKLRRNISQLIAENRADIVQTAIQLRPELFADSDNITYAHRVAEAHEVLASDDAYFGSSSRQVAAAAIDEGAPSMLVGGDHSGLTGMINYLENTTFDTSDALNSDMPTYDHDTWAAQQMLNLIPTAQISSTSLQRETADLIDAIGTMRALGVIDIAVRQ
jgi:hypothetical protein